MSPPVTPRSPWRVAPVRALPGWRLHVLFNDGTEGEVDMAAFVHAPDAGVFTALRDEALLRRARVVLGAVTWPGGLDLAPDAMDRAIGATGRWTLS